MITQNFGVSVHVRTGSFRDKVTSEGWDDLIQFYSGILLMVHSYSAQDVSLHCVGQYSDGRIFGQLWEKLETAEGGADPGIRLDRDAQ